MTRRVELPGKAESYWLASYPSKTFETFATGSVMDVAVIGAGIVGITTALLLAQEGKKVALIEGRKVLSGVTGHTTAKVTSLHTLIYDHLINKFGMDEAKLYADANETAIKQIALMVNDYNIECDFFRKPFYTFAESSETLDSVKKEVEAARKLGLPASFQQEVPLPLKSTGAVKFDNQIQFHPTKYLAGLLVEAQKLGVSIFENTMATDVEDGEPCVITTNHGDLRARDVVVATHFPFYDKPGFFFARLEVMRSYVLAVRIGRKFPEGMFISAESNGKSFRAQGDEGGELIIIGGEDHKTGHEDDTIHRYGQLEKYVRSVFDVQSIDYHWSTQDNSTFDQVPFIGKISSGSDHLYAATGFGQWGMTSGTLSGMLITDLIMGRRNPWSDVFSPARIKATGTGSFLAQQFDVAKDFVMGRFGSKPKRNADSLSVDEGAIIDMNGENVAAYKDEMGKTFKLDPTCKHMGCPVNWNNAERSWDCPCHGSRYHYNGKVIHGPAVEDLDQKK